MMAGVEPDHLYRRQLSIHEDQIQNIQDVDEGMDLLEELGIDTAGIVDLLQVRKTLREHLQQEIIRHGFACSHCDISEDQISSVRDLSEARNLLSKHHVIGEDDLQLDEALRLLRRHFSDKIRLEPFDTNAVADVVEKLMKENTLGRLKMLAKWHKTKDFIRDIPKARMGDVNNQLPTLAEDMESVCQQLNKDNCTIMLAGETGAGKSCLLNLLLGELTSELLAVGNLPETATICEIKYAEKRMLKAYPVDYAGNLTGPPPPVEVALTEDTAPQLIAQYTSETGAGRSRSMKYRRVEVYWPCEWIKHGITITDTPGVGENPEFTQAVKDYIPNASGFMYVINLTNAGGINPDELGDLLFYHITKQGITNDNTDETPNTTSANHDQDNIVFNPRSAIFICNKWDTVAEAERQEVKNYVKGKLEKVWSDFDFENQVFFLSLTETKKDIETGFVPREYRRLLDGIQKLLPIGFKTRMENQFWKMHHILDRCTWVLANYIHNNASLSRQGRIDQYLHMRQRLNHLEQRPEKLRRQMNELIQQEVSSTMRLIEEHLLSAEASDRLGNWKELECPDNDNLNRLRDIQISTALQKIKEEINRFEEEQHVFENLQKKIVNTFKTMFSSVESELASIENTVETSSLISYSNYYTKGGKPIEIIGSNKKIKNKLFSKRAPIWTPMRVVMNKFVSPFAARKMARRLREENLSLEEYRSNRVEAMSRITKEQVNELMQSGKLQDIIKEKLVFLCSKFERLLDRIPVLIGADRILLQHLEKDAGENFQAYVPLAERGMEIMGEVSYQYMCNVRTYDVDIDRVGDITEISSGAFGIVYKGTLSMGYGESGGEMVVAMKRLKQPLSEKNAVEFMTEEIHIKRIRTSHIVGFVGTAVRRVKNLIFPVIIQEYCESTLQQVIYDSAHYTAPGSLPAEDLGRPGSERQAARYCYEMYSGVQAMHALGLVHRDLKPANILIDTAGHLKLCDLGLTIKEVDIIREQAGSVLYMAPEVKNKKRYNRSADLFSLGLIGWEVWCGRCVDPVYDGENYTTFIQNPFPACQPPSPDWAELLGRCWAHEPQQRPTAEECAMYFKEKCGNVDVEDCGDADLIDLTSTFSDANLVYSRT